MSAERLQQLLEDAEGLPDSAAKIAVLDEACREADALGDLDMGFEIRQETLRVGVFSGAVEKSVVAFSWCLAQVDKDPDRFDEGELMWGYKWILGNIAEFPEVSQQQISSMSDDMKRRIERLGFSLRPHHYLRWKNHFQMGQFEQALPHVEKWQEAEQDWLADCEACECDSYVEMCCAMGKNDEAVAAAEPILKGDMECKEVPHLTLANLLRPLLRLRRAEEARNCHKEGYKLISKDPNFLRSSAEHLLYVTATGDLARGVKLLEAHLPWAASSAMLLSRLRLMTSATLLLEKLAGSREGTVQLTLPKGLACYDANNTYKPVELADWFGREIQALAARFDRRNGNDYETRDIEECRKLVQAGV